MTASIFFTAPKLEPAYEMASNPIQITGSDSFSSLDYGYALSPQGCNSAPWSPLICRKISARM